jgi:L-amino acid N-acyltransferase YncA
MDSSRILYRTAALSDATRLVEIYAPYVEKTAITFEYEVPTVGEFRDRMRYTLEKYPYIVAELDGKIVGYTYAGAFVGRAAYDWSAETTIYMDPALRHSGLGGRLYAKLEAACAAMHIQNLNACIGLPKKDDEYLTSNSADFHAHIGYSLVGVFHDSGYKFGRWYDMIWMEKMLGSHPDQPEPVVPYESVRSFLREKYAIL